MSDQILQARRIVVTGAGRGLGRAFAVTAADCGADVVLLGRDTTALDGVAEIIRVRTARESTVVRCDLAQSNSVAAACEAVFESGSIVDVLVNNGAPWLEGDLDTMSDADITSTVSAAVSGTILITKGLLPGLHRSTAADVLTIISTSGYLGWDVSGGSVPFYAAKHGQSGFSDRLRHELKDTNIRVSALYPPDFEDVDPTAREWERDNDSKNGANLTNREIVSAMLFMIGAPRTCSFPVVIMDSKRHQSN